MMEVTDSKWLGVIVNDSLIAHVLRSTWPSNTLNWRRYILLMTFRLSIGEMGSLKDTR